jgi:hypothetical protein
LCENIIVDLLEGESGQWLMETGSWRRGWSKEEKWFPNTVRKK